MRRRADFFWIALGGMLGAACRAALGEALAGVTFPLATLAANLLGTAGLALLAVASGRLRRWQRALLGTGFCGAFTTVSTFSAELAGMIEAGQTAMAGAYLLLSLGSALPMAIFLLRWHPPQGEGAAQ
ncbi:MAG: fluoride efflux transporter FluC [Verrucomicrobiota bacterium]